MKIKVSCLRSINDNASFKILEVLGADVFSVNDLENIDEEIEKLINKKYNTIILSSEVAGFSEDIITKYNKLQKVNIIIAKGKKQNNV